MTYQEMVAQMEKDAAGREGEVYFVVQREGAKDKDVWNLTGPMTKDEYDALTGGGQNAFLLGQTTEAAKDKDVWNVT